MATFSLSFARPFGVNITVSDLFAAAALLVLFVRHQIRLDGLFLGPAARWLRPYVVGVSVMTLGFMVSVARAEVPFVAIVGTLQYCFAMVAMPLLFYATISTRRRLNTMYGAYFLSLALAIAAALFFRGRPAPFLQFTVGTIRVGSVFQNPNIFGKTLVVGACAAGYSIFLVRSRRSALLLGAFLAGAALGVLLAASYGAVVLGGPAVALAMAAGLWRGGKKRGAMMVAILPILVLGALGLRGRKPLPLVTRYERDGSLEYAHNYDVKSAMMRQGPEDFLRNPFIGAGVGNYWFRFGPYTVAMHNFYLSVALEGGLLALAGMALCIWAMARVALRLFKVDRDNGWIVFSLMGLLSTSITNNAMFSRYWWFPVYFVFSRYLLARAGWPSSFRVRRRPLSAEPIHLHTQAQRFRVRGDAIADAKGRAAAASGGRG